MTILTVESLLRLSGLLYQAAYDDSLWSIACNAIRQEFDCSAATLMIRHGSRFNRVHGDCDPYYSDLYWHHLIHDDPLQAGPANDPERSVYTDQSVLNKSDFHKTAMFNEWFAPQKIQGVLLLKTFDQHGVNTIFTLNRGAGQADFNANDIAAMQALDPIVAHVTRARQHMATLRLRTRSTTFDEMYVGHIVVDKHRRALHMNATADKLFLNASLPLLMNQNRLDTRDGKTTDALQRLISQSCAGPNHPGVAGGELLLRTGDAPSLTLSVYPLPADMDQGIGTQYAASIVINPIGFTSLAIETRLQNLLGLSNKEAVLAVAMLNGHSPQLAAEQRNVSIATVRSQLASLFQKTGTTRQGQLVALLARLAGPL